MYGHPQSYQGDLIPKAERNQVKKPEWANEESFKKSGIAQSVALMTDFFVNNHSSGKIGIQENVNRMLRKAQYAYDHGELNFPSSAEVKTAARLAWGKLQQAGMRRATLDEGKARESNVGSPGDNATNQNISNNVCFDFYVNSPLVIKHL